MTISLQSVKAILLCSQLTTSVRHSIAPAVVAVNPKATHTWAAAWEIARRPGPEAFIQITRKWNMQRVGTRTNRIELGVDTWSRHSSEMWNTINPRGVVPGLECLHDWHKNGEWQKFGGRVPRFPHYAHGQHRYSSRDIRIWKSFALRWYQYFRVIR